MRLCRHSAGGGGGVAGIQTCSVVPTSSVKIHSISGTPMGTFRLVALLLFFILFIIFFFWGGGGGNRVLHVGCWRGRRTCATDKDFGAEHSGGISIRS